MKIENNNMNKEREQKNRQKIEKWLEMKKSNKIIKSPSCFLEKVTELSKQVANLIKNK